jgi:hypothetical protein
MELHRLKLDDLIIGNPLFEERVLVNERLKLFAGLDADELPVVRLCWPYGSAKTIGSSSLPFATRKTAPDQQPARVLDCLELS